MAPSAERCDMYHDAIKILSRDAIGVFLLNQLSATLYKENIAGLSLSDDGTLGSFNHLILSDAYIKE